MNVPRIVLERVLDAGETGEDERRLLQWVRTEEELLRWAGASLRAPFDADGARGLFRDALAAGDSHRVFRARLAEDDRPVVGHIELRQIDARHGSARVGRVLLDPERRGQRLGVAMVRALVDHAFGELELRRLDLEVFPDNAAALRSYEAVGFVREGVRRQVLRSSERCFDLVGMGMLRSEWRAKDGQA